MGAMYRIPITGVVYSAANAPMDLLEIVPAANQLVIVHELKWGNRASELSEALRLVIFHGYTTAGSGGATPTPRPLSQQYAAAGLTTVRSGATTPASTAGVDTGTEPWNALSGGHILPTPEAREEITGSDRLVFHLPDSPAAADLTLDGFCIIEVRGG